jgi:hypothetical protein
MDSPFPNQQEVTMTKQEIKALGEQIVAEVPALSNPKPFVGTWRGVPGWSLTLKAPNGSRVVVHKLDNVTTATVQHNKGDFMHNPDKAVVYWRTACEPGNIVATIAERL